MFTRRQWFKYVVDFIECQGQNEKPFFMYFVPLPYRRGKGGENRSNLQWEPQGMKRNMPTP